MLTTARLTAIVLMLIACMALFRSAQLAATKGPVEWPTFYLSPIKGPKAIQVAKDFGLGPPRPAMVAQDETLVVGRAWSLFARHYEFSYYVGLQRRRVITIRRAGFPFTHDEIETTVEGLSVEGSSHYHERKRIDTDVGLFWTNVVICAVVPASLLSWLIMFAPFQAIAWRRRRAGRCVRCGYKLVEGGLDRCPECGQ